MRGKRLIELAVSEYTVGVSLVEDGPCRARGT